MIWKRWIICGQSHTVYLNLFNGKLLESREDAFKKFPNHSLITALLELTNLEKNMLNPWNQHLKKNVK